MGLVEYSDSESEELPPSPPAKKRRKTSGGTTEQGVGREELPPLPTSFLDQYSSTVRTTIQDDPSLHGGRKRVTPHVEGNWPTHVYLEWHPPPNEQKLLSQLASAAQASYGAVKVHNLLENDLGVTQPLHVSLSRPLVLKTAEKDLFLAKIEQVLKESGTKAFDAQGHDLAWHPNESRSRWFLVLRLQNTPRRELSKLLEVCNSLAHDYQQPELYTDTDNSKSSPPDIQFHISIAWALKPPPSTDTAERSSLQRQASVRTHEDVGIPYELLALVSGLSVSFNEVKVRIGQEVHSIVLKARRQ